jgi:membrane protein implicated in regulation of membrane protease activity
MRYITAIVGALFIFVAVFILSAFLVPLYPAFLRQWVNLGFISTNNIVGALLASLAATSSFRATLRRHAKKKIAAPVRTDKEDIDRRVKDLENLE